MIFLARTQTIFFKQCHFFWQRHPALQYGFALALGNLLGLCGNPCLFFFIGAFLLTLYHPERKFPCLVQIFCVIAVSSASFLYVKATIQFPEELEEATAHFHIHSINASQKNHSEGWIYRGMIKKCADKNGKICAQNIPCDIYIKQDWSRPAANRDYLIDGKLSKIRNRYRLKIDGKPWRKLKGTFSFAESRFKAKTALKSYLKKKIPSSRAFIFLTGISTGIFNDPLMMKEFGQTGLQHILAISGFHFSLIAAFFGLFLRALFPPKITAGILLILLSGYFFFIGMSPSIERAYLTYLIFLLGQLFEKRSFSLNSLGMALIIILICHPLDSLHLGFQFSFLATGAILVGMQPFEQLLESIFKPRRLKEVIHMRLFDQHGYLLISFFRQSLALTLAVHLATLPLILFHFHQFPILSLIYNLFFPLLVTFSLLMLLCGLFFSFIPWVSDAIHIINSHYTNSILKFIENPSHTFAHTFHIQEIQPLALAVFYSLLFLSAIFFYKKERTLGFL